MPEERQFKSIFGTGSELEFSPDTFAQAPAEDQTRNSWLEALDNLSDQIDTFIAYNKETPEDDDEPKGLNNPVVYSVFRAIDEYAELFGIDKDDYPGKARLAQALNVWIAYESNPITDVYYPDQLIKSAEQSVDTIVADPAVVDMFANLYSPEIMALHLSPSPEVSADPELPPDPEFDQTADRYFSDFVPPTFHMPTSRVRRDK